MQVFTEKRAFFLLCTFEMNNLLCDLRLANGEYTFPGHLAAKHKPKTNKFSFLVKLRYLDKRFFYFCCTFIRFSLSFSLARSATFCWRRLCSNFHLKCLSSMRKYFQMNFFHSFNWQKTESPVSEKAKEEKESKKICN